MRKLQLHLPDNRAPWKVPWTARLSALNAAIARREKIVVGIYDDPNIASFRYRLYNVSQSLNDDSEIGFFYFFLDEIDWLKQHIRKIDCLILARNRWTLDLQNLIDIAKSQKIPVVFDIDDMFCDLKDLLLITNTLNVQLQYPNEYDSWTACLGRTYMVAWQADAYITTNHFLSDQMYKKFQKKCHVIENSLNEEQVRLSEEICRLKRQTPRDHRFTIGYFSGTPSHINDFRIVAPELMALLRDYSEIDLEVVGFMEFPQEMKQFIDQKRIVFHPLVDFLELQVLMGEVDINIAPLVANTFTNCKSELKFFEAAIVETVTCATPIYTYEHSIVHGETGFLCRQGEWYDTIADICKGKYDLDRIARKAKQYCLNRYYGEAFRNSVKKVLAEFF